MAMAFAGVNYLAIVIAAVAAWIAGAAWYILLEADRPTKRQKRA